MNRIKARIEYEKNVRKYCLNCKSCYSNYNNPKKPVSNTVSELMRGNYWITESPNSSEQSFVSCFKSKEEEK